MVNVEVRFVIAGQEVALGSFAEACASPKFHPASKLLNLIHSHRALTSTRALRKTFNSDCDRRILLRGMALPDCARRSVADPRVCNLRRSFVAVMQTAEPR
jgi:hypothetical protein